MKNTAKQKELEFYFSQIRESFSIMVFSLEEKKIFDEEFLEKHVKKLEENFEKIKNIK